MSILVLTTADTDILALRSVADGLPEGFPAIRASNPATLASGEPSLDDVECVIVRLLGGRRAWSDGFDDLRERCIAADIPLLAFGGEGVPDAELHARSTVAPSILAQAFEYLVHGGLDNTEQLLRFAADTVLMGGWGFDPPSPVPSEGIWRESAASATAPRVGIVFYRAHVLSGNTTFVDDMVDAVEAAGGAARAVWCYSLRPDADGRVVAVDLLHDVDVVVTTVLAAGSAADDQWDAGALAGLDVPIVQAICATSDAATWMASDAALTPTDVAMSVAIPEFDGRIITVPVSTKEVVDDGETLGSPVTAYRVIADRARRVAEIAVRLGRLRATPLHARRLAIVLSAYPTRRSRIGNAVGLDTPASVVALLHALRDAGYRVDRIPADGDALMAELAEGLTYESDALSAAQVAAAPWRWPADAYRSWWATTSPDARDAVEHAWGPAPGSVHIDPADGSLVFSGIDLGGVIVAVQPPRGFGDDPIAVYHSPDLPPTHHYLGFYRWLDLDWGADAVIHAGKHGTLEWLPGNGVGLSSDCYPDVALGSMPLVYPFVVNDPGEGTQAKRRAHAVIVDHLVPPMTRADSYDEIARLEALLDEHAQMAALDPSKVPAIRQQVWDLVVDASLHRDLGWTAPPGDEDLLHLDGYLCELKDAQIRGGLHVLGQPPADDALIDMVLAITRLPQGDVPALRPPADALADADRLEAAARARVVELRDRGWPPGDPDPTLDWVGRALLPSLERTTDEITSVMAALDGRFVAPGPSGAPTRGMAHVLPTGRNLYSVDPKALPSRLAWTVGSQLADAVCARHMTEMGRLPETVGIVLWGTSAMRTAGDDVAEALALLGVRPVWAPESPRVVGIEPIPLAELGRPRIDVTLRISGFFRDAFPHLIHMVDDAVELVAGLDESPEDNFVRAHGPDPRVFGAKPGAYGSGVLGVLETGNWRSDEDLAAVYTAWSGWSYGRAGMGLPAVAAMERRFTAIEVAVKNQDNREHDIFDSDDYLQDHGGMIATVRSLRAAAGLTPSRAWFGDSSDPSRPRVRSLAEEAARVVRTRVVNPKWIDAMRRHGYKGAFEMAATVDYLYGYDATAGVVEDWMYERVTSAYVADAGVRKFFAESNPWALKAIAERLLEAVDRQLWQEPSPAALAALRAAVLEGEGWEEER